MNITNNFKRPNYITELNSNGGLVIIIKGVVYILVKIYCFGLPSYFYGSVTLIIQYIYV